MHVPADLLRTRRQFSSTSCVTCRPDPHHLQQLQQRPMP
jgi:hypothetical protein